VLLELPWKQDIPQITVFRKPRTFPAGEPVGPWHKEHVDKEDRLLDLSTLPVREKTLCDAASQMYDEMEDELAQKYSIDICEQKLFEGKSAPNPYRGRGRDMGTKTVPLFNTSQGISAGNQVSGFYRRLNARAREFMYLRGKQEKTSKEYDDMFNLSKSLPRATPPNCDRPEEWKDWRSLVWWGLWRVDEGVFKMVLSGLLFRARQIAAPYGANRGMQFKKWLTANAPSGDASVFRWLRERPPLLMPLSTRI
jgi:hypothetical protein